VRSPLTCHRCGGTGHQSRHCQQPEPERAGPGCPDWQVHSQRLEQERAAVGEIANLLHAKVLRHRWPVALVHALKAAQQQEVGPLHAAELEQLETAIKAVMQ
jgi:hypothetical protein